MNNTNDKKTVKAELKKQRQESLRQYSLKNKQLKEAKKQAVSQYKENLKKLTLAYNKELFSINSQKDLPQSKQKIADLKNKYEHDKVQLIVDREYLIAKYQLSDKSRDRIKMKADKKMSYHEYCVKKQKLQTQHKVYLKKLKTQYQEYKHQYKQNLGKANNIDEKKALKIAFMNATNQYDLAIIKSKISFKNQLVQFQQERDLSYQYEIDRGFILKRWFYGIGKEFQRMTWPTLNQTLKDYFIVAAVSIIIALIFMAVDYIYTAL